ncbi:MAG: tetratricopeptide (TPR) repeat protein [Myxococcota bacterium]|jgi:tetratricopeptide (TPR) repeat protein
MLSPREVLTLATALLFVGSALAQPPALQSRVPTEVATDVKTAQALNAPPSLARAGKEFATSDFVAAEKTLTSLLATETSDRDAALACVLLGVLLHDQARSREAAGVLGTCPPPETVGDLHGLTLGKALLATASPAEAVAPIRRVADQLDSPLAPEAGFLLGTALFESGQWKRAKIQLTRMIKRYPEYPQSAMVHYRLARSAEMLGSKRVAAAHYAKLLRKAPEKSAAARLGKTALDALVEAGVRRPRQSFNDRLDRAQKLRRKRMWPEALAILDALAPKARKRGVKAEIHYQRMRCLESLDRYEEALAALKLARRYSGGNAELVNAKIRLLRKLGKTEAAIKMIERRAGKSKRVRALAAAPIWFADGWYDKAYSLWRKHLRTRHSRGNQWMLAWSAYRAGEYKRALKGFAALAGKVRKYKAEYWHARALMKSERLGEAATEFESIARRDVVGYYGLQAANRLLDLGKHELYREITGVIEDHVPNDALRAVPGGSIRWNGADGADLELRPRHADATAQMAAAAEKWGKTLAHLPRARDRYRMGLHESARVELRVARSVLKQATRVHPRKMANLPNPLWFEASRRKKRGLWGSRLDHGMGFNKWQKAKRRKHWKSVRDTASGASQAIRGLLVAVGDPYWKRKDVLSRHWRAVKNTAPDDDNRQLFSAVYPMAFERTLREETSQYKISPFLMASIARVESGFNELAVSYAGARGLVQVLPMTGNLIAQRRGDTEFAPSLLLDPRVSLSYGTWYMNELIDKFNGQEPMAIISYNCGPHRVDKWLARRGGISDTDEFIEEVPYRQSRRYVKSVLRYISLYRRTYLDRADFYVGQRLDPTFKQNINW